MIKNIFQICIGSLIAISAIEVTLQLSPVSTSTQMGYSQDEYVKTYPANYAFKSSDGWDMRHPTTQTTNNLGFASSQTLTPDANAIAVIGDSFVEGIAVEEPLRIATQLANKLSEHQVFMLGFRGTSLIDYADRAQWAAKMLGVNQFIFVLSNSDVWESICGTGQHLRRCIDPQLNSMKELPVESRGRLYQLASYSAVAQYMLVHLRLSASALRAKLPFSTKQEPGQSGHLSNNLRLVEPAELRSIEYFINELVKIPGNRVLLAVDCNRGSIYKNQVPPRHASLKLLIERARSLGFAVADSCEEFTSIYTSSKKRFDASLTDSHWNARGHALMAGVVAQAWLAKGGVPRK